MNRYNFGKDIVSKTWANVCNKIDRWADKVESTISKWVDWLFNLFGRKENTSEKNWKVIKMNQPKIVENKAIWKKTWKLVNMTRSTTANTLAA